jgi:predicted enzyme related to lactoylglutathione lyase
VPASLRCEIFPPDLDATVDFYTHVLGFNIARDERTAKRPYVAFERGTVKLGAAERKDPHDREHRRPPTGVELVLEVDSLEAERERVAQAGWAVVEDITARPWGLSDFRLLDPSGYYWRITEASSTPRTPSR